jgi:hypothetical protein
LRLPEGDAFIRVKCELPLFSLDDKRTLTARKSDSSPSWDWPALLINHWQIHCTVVESGCFSRCYLGAKSPFLPSVSYLHDQVSCPRVECIVLRGSTYPWVIQARSFKGFALMVLLRYGLVVKMLSSPEPLEALGRQSGAGMDGQGMKFLIFVSPA